MRAAQREIGFARMVERGLAPIAAVVTVLTGRTIESVMGVVIAVTRDAIRGQADLPRWLAVAGAALDRSVPAPQRKGCSAVIEPLHRPTNRRVTRSAIAAEMPCMRVICAVAVDACRRRAVVAFIGVTGDALRARVGADERITRFRMIEANLAPTLVIVARAAALAEPATVRLVA